MGSIEHLKSAKPRPARQPAWRQALCAAVAVGAIGAAQAAPADGTYRLVSACPGNKVIEILGGGIENHARAMLWEWQGEEHQKWKLESLEEGMHRLVAMHTGMVLDASRRMVEDGVGVFQQFEWHSGPSQRFTLSDAGDGHWRIAVQRNGTFVTLRDAGTADGTTLWQQPEAADCSQLWRFEPVDDTTGTPVAVQVVEGDGQTAVAETVLPVRPAVKVLDPSGLPVAGVTVEFRVVSGGGTVTGEIGSTDASGIYAVGSWTLGSTIGEQKLAASSPGLPEVVFVATATAPSGVGTLTMGGGSDNQTGIVGAALPIPLRVTVRDSADSPVAGVSVSFSVTSGGGAIEQVSAVSDRLGVASAGRWTLGPTVGTQTVRASADGYASATFSATGLAATAPSFTREVLLRSVYEVWDMAFAPDGAMLFTQRGRGLSVRLPNGEVKTVYAPPDLVSEDQSGALGIALDPAFASNRRLYMYMSSNRSGLKDNRVVRFSVDADYGGISGRTDIVTGISYQRGSQYGGRHSGGDVDFGPDGYLYITTGDTRTGTVPQNLRQLGGKVLRVDTSGDAAPGNDAPAGADPRIYGYGFRNPQGLAMRPGGGVYLIEHGPGSNDEVTRLRAGGNGGWDPRPRPLGAENAACPNGTKTQYCGYEGADMTDRNLFPDAMVPVWRSGRPARGTGGGDFLVGSNWRLWDGALVIAQMSGRRLLVLELDPTGTQVVSQTELLNTTSVRIRNAVLGLDGALYLSTSSDSNERRIVATEVWRLTPK